MKWLLSIFFLVLASPLSAAAQPNQASTLIEYLCEGIRTTAGFQRVERFSLFLSTRGNLVSSWQLGDDTPSDLITLREIAHSTGRMECYFSGGQAKPACNFTLDQRNLILIMASEPDNSWSSSFALQSSSLRNMMERPNYTFGTRTSRGGIISKGSCQRVRR